MSNVGKNRKPLSEVETELARLKRELAEVKMERDLLKNGPKDLSLFLSSEKLSRLYFGKEERPPAYWCFLPVKRHGPGMIMHVILATPPWRSRLGTVTVDFILPPNSTVEEALCDPERLLPSSPPLCPHQPPIPPRKRWAGQPTDENQGYRPRQGLGWEDRGRIRLPSLTSRRIRVRSCRSRSRLPSCVHP